MSKLIVGVGDMIVSNSETDTIITYALGSCLGVTIYDSVARVGGMLHAMLPDSSISKKNVELNIHKYVNTGIPALFKAAYDLGAKKSRIKLKMAGCSQILDESNFFNIGEKNYAAARKLLWKNNMMIESEYCDKSESITLAIDIINGEVIMKINNKTMLL
jgi:chemotaxis protein CheD